ncbi:properdin-like [Takifugu flavidus]|uniref:properdin-like n=1 Tax=Takifugu flavidus TaxID=433684 RepID=UPI0025447D6E|nr:properdin-like [Takifugu flavidus]
MEVRAALSLVLVLASVERSAGVRCFSQFNQGQCVGELGEVEEDDCCQNPRYGHKDTDGQCRSCGPPVWSPWSSWSYCNVLCGDGVSQRTRTCFGIGQSECENAEDKLQFQPCSGSCCDAKGWSLWQAWSSCTVSCGEGGVRRRHRVCSGPPECHAACTGPSDETEECPTSITCPVHGGWSGWSGWTECSGPCIAGSNIPSRTRRRSCSSPTPSADTRPPGNRCPGDELQRQGCTGLPNCPVDGGWGAWAPAGKCSASCGEGLQLSVRTCDQPTPKYGGQFCAGPSTKATVCHVVCPVDGFWSGWSNWGECSSSCIPQGQAPVRTRSRSCTNPAPSTSPPGKGCSGERSQAQNCDQLPNCPVDGGWSSWTSFSACPVTCGVGLQVSDRKCNNPPAKHGGQPCPGEQRRSKICKTNVHCPVDGSWSSWSEWSQCKSPFSGRDIRCIEVRGSQKRIRECLHRDHNGSICAGDQLSEIRVCYDVHQCYLKGNWEGWENWSMCKPSCGKSQRFRRRFCKPNYSNYNPARHGQLVAFSGTPRADCGATPDGGPKIESQACSNLPPCP